MHLTVLKRVVGHVESGRRSIHIYIMAATAAFVGSAPPPEAPVAAAPHSQLHNQLFRSVEQRTRGLPDAAQAARRITGAVIKATSHQELEEHCTDERWLRKKIEATAQQALGDNLTTGLEQSLRARIIHILPPGAEREADKATRTLVKSWGKCGLTIHRITARPTCAAMLHSTHHMQAAGAWPPCATALLGTQPA